MTDESFENAEPVNPASFRNGDSGHFEPVSRHSVAEGGSRPALSSQRPVNGHSAASGVGRTLPHSMDAEQYLISSCMLDGADVVARCIVAGIMPTHFYEPKHAIIYSVILDLYRQQRPTELAIVAEELKTARQLEAVGGIGFLVEMSDSIPTTAQASYFIEKVKEMATLRELIRACTSGVEDCYSYSGGLDEFTTKIADRIVAASGFGTSNDEEPIQKVARDFAADLDLAPSQRKSSASNVSWGLVDIDKVCGLMPPGGLVILAGMPSTGKSALADRIAWQNASAGNHVLMFTYEMTKADKVKRIAQQESRLSFSKFDEAPRDRKLEFCSAVRRIGECPTLHVFENDKTVARVSARCRNFSQRKKVGLIIVDFLQYLGRLEPTIDRERSDEKLARITGELKQVAKSCDCPVLLLSSLNRSEYKDGNRPSMAGLKGSGDIESDGDVVAILHWPEKNPATGEEQDPHDESSAFYVEFNQEKGRNSGVKRVPLTFLRDVTTFENYIA